MREETRLVDPACPVSFADGRALSADRGAGSTGQGPAARRSCGALPKWRLRRVAEYVDRRLGENIRLAELAAEVRLTPMHFAAQFKVATGLRPHEYLLRRRIERAQALLLDSDETIVDIALIVGFQTQAHFTTVFKRFAGEPPYRWRSAALDERQRARERLHLDGAATPPRPVGGRPSPRQAIAWQASASSAP